MVWNRIQVTIGKLAFELVQETPRSTDKTKPNKAYLVMFGLVQEFDLLHEKRIKQPINSYLNYKLAADHAPFFSFHPLLPL
jgi:hypothetical protein